MFPCLLPGASALFAVNVTNGTILIFLYCQDIMFISSCAALSDLSSFSKFTSFPGLLLFLTGTALQGGFYFFLGKGYLFVCLRADFILPLD